jgi:hypothetical protein
MPKASSKAQRRIMGMALAYKRMSSKEKREADVSDEVKELSKIPEKSLRKFAKTKEKNLPHYVEGSKYKNKNESLTFKRFLTDYLGIEESNL